MLPPALALGLLLLAAAPAAASPAPSPALVDSLLSKDEPTWRQAALELSFTGLSGARAVAARGERLKPRHRAVQTYLMLSLLQSTTPEELRALPALENFWEPAVAEARQWMQRPVAYQRPGPRQNPAKRTESLTPEQQEAEKNARAVKRMQGFLVPIFLERLESPEPNAALDAVLALERLECWSGRAAVERLAGDPKRGPADVAVKSARRYLDSYRKAAEAPFAAALKPRLAAMVAFEEAAEPDALYQGLLAAAPAALQAKTAEQFWSLVRPSFAGFWRAAASPVEARGPAMAAWADRNRGYSISTTEGAGPLKLRIAGPGLATTVTVTDAGTGKAVKQGPLPLSVDPVPAAGVRIAAQVDGRKIQLDVPPSPSGLVSVELLRLTQP